MAAPAAMARAASGENEEESSVRRVGDARSALFRHEALNAYRRGDAISAPLEVIPLTTRALLITLLAAVVGATLVLCLGEVEMTSRGRAVMRARAGVQPLLFETGGVLRDVLVQVGEGVSAGQIIARLDSSALSAALLEAEAQLEAVREHGEREDQLETSTMARDRELLRARADLMMLRIASLETSVERFTQEADRQAALAREGLTTEETIAQRREALAEQRRGVLGSRDELARIEQQLLALEREQRTNATARQERLSQARARRDAARFSLEQTTLRAPRAGRIESLMVNAGEVLGQGGLVAVLVASDRPDLITAFVPERDRAFVRLGDGVRLELDQLPPGEFGRAEATIARISSEVASAEEMQRALGAAAPSGVHFRVELSLSARPESERLTASLSSGSLMTVKLTLRRRRLVELLFDPIRKWVD